MRAAGTPVPRIVLDTNVCLDLFVFRDPLCSHLLSAMQRGAVQAVTREDCRAEWQRVLHYPQLPVDEVQRPAFVAAFDAAIQLLPPEASTLREGDPDLPRCADPDDQKFLELAAMAGAQALLSRDDALLRLARRTQRDGLFAILPPWTWREIESA